MVLPILTQMETQERQVLPVVVWQTIIKKIGKATFSIQGNILLNQTVIDTWKITLLVPTDPWQLS
jgi:hypothetical protein